MIKISTENLVLLPNPSKLRRICKSISAIEAIICPEWEYRYYSYQKDWSENEEFCEMRTGQGDHMLILFSDKGTCVNGFAHESKLNGWKKIPNETDKFESKSIQKIANGVVDSLPKLFDEFIYGEPVKSIGTTFCIWQTREESNWKIGEIVLPNDDYKDGSSDLLELLDGRPTTYKNWAKGYYEENFDGYELKLDSVEKVFNEIVITKEIVNQINPKYEDFEQLKSELEEIGCKYNF